MPIYRTDATSVDISREAVIVDTNVLVTAFDPKEPNHKGVRYFLDEFPHQWLIPVAVIVETWGFLVGSRNAWQSGYELLAWLTTPGKNILVIPQLDDLDKERELIETFVTSRLDYVDAVICKLANEISIQCSLGSSLRLATYDTSDFIRLKSQRYLRATIYDMKSLEDIDF